MNVELEPLRAEETELKPLTSRLEDPPDALIYRVTGVKSADWFRRSGELSVKDIQTALNLVGKRLADCQQILDFGCGSGRILAWMSSIVAPERLWGVDIDAEAIAWLRAHLPGVNVQVNQPLPPLPFADEKFDLVYCHSVFTHLDEHYQDAWLEELRRVTQPNAILILSFSGDHCFRTFEENWRAAGADPAPFKNQLTRQGLLFIEDDEWKPHFPDFYHTTFHTPEYIEDHWGRYFRIRGHLPRGSLDFQDFVVLERSPLSHTASLKRAQPNPNMLNSPSDDQQPAALATVPPLPPHEYRRLVGCTDDHFYDNPTGALIFPEVPAECYEAVFDFGCGCGRLARQLLQQKVRPKRYIGIDIQHRLVNWCCENLSRIDNKFQFLHHDVANISLAPDNSPRDTAPFPVANSSHSLILAHSVFTHLLQHQTEFYLGEIKRILTEDGIAYTTWFFFDRIGFPWLEPHQVCLFVNSDDPTNAVIYDRKWFVEAVRAAGLAVWKTNPAVVPGHQWQVYLVHRSKLATDHFPLGEEAGDRVCGAAPFTAKASPPDDRSPEIETLLTENRELKEIVGELVLESRRAKT